MSERRKYEGLFIFPPEETPEASREEEKHLDETIRRLGGKVLERNDWGRRPLGYPLRKLREGRVLLWNFEIDTPQLAELRRTLRLDEKILKSTIVRKEEPKPATEETRRRKKKKKFFRPTTSREKETKEEVHARKSQ